MHYQCMYHILGTPRKKK